MFFYGTVKTYAEPWLERVMAYITEQVREENQALTKRLDHIELALTVDFNTADLALQDIQNRLQASQHDYGESERTLNALQTRLEDVEERNRCLGADVARIHQRLANMEASEKNNHTSEKGLIETRKRIHTLENSVKETNSYTEKLKQSIETIDKQQTVLHETIGNGPMLTMMDRLGQLDVRLTALEANLDRDKLERENSKLKRKSFLQLSRT